ncbi:hypothetical protein EJ110_NYTH46082 [Nymphaea thermarum]|nr:hypothetical protein EJ110_NYTH46082 [Nymphaea thermarum]
MEVIVGYAEEPPQWNMSPIAKEAKKDIHEIWQREVGEWNIRPIAKKAKKDIHEIWQREVGEVYPRVFAHRIAGSEDLVRRLDVHAKLEKHRGCVNTVSFNAAGDILVSGSDDRSVVLWDWDAQHVKSSFHSGHSNNVFQAKIMPFTDDLSSVTCAADGQYKVSVTVPLCLSPQFV